MKFLMARHLLKFHILLFSCSIITSKQKLLICLNVSSVENFKFKTTLICSTSCLNKLPRRKIYYPILITYFYFVVATECLVMMSHVKKIHSTFFRYQKLIFYSLKFFLEYDFEIFFSVFVENSVKMCS